MVSSSDTTFYIPKNLYQHHHQSGTATSTLGEYELRLRSGLENVGPSACRGYHPNEGHGKVISAAPQATPVTDFCGDDDTTRV